MTLSSSHGTAGSSITVTVTSCSSPSGGYSGFFADSRALATPDDPSLRHRLTFLAGSSGALTAHYTLTSKDAGGGGIFEIQCGSNANATASFTVG